MSPVNLEKVVPGLEEQRAQERHNRAFAFAGLTHTVCGQELLPLTPGHRLQLQLMQNAFTSPGVYPTLVDVFVFLWVVSPHNKPGIEAARRQYFLRQDVANMDLAVAVTGISKYIRACFQDTAAAGTGEGKDQSPWIHWFAMDSAFYLTEFGLKFEEYQRTPYAVLQQMHRVWQVNHPTIERMKDGTTFVRDPIFANDSDKLVRQFHRQYRDEVKRRILAQKERLN